MEKKNNIHTISLFVANKPGVLIRCSQIFARRGFNIDSLVVSPAVNPKFSRMTITAQGDPATLEQIIKQTAKLIDVVHAEEHREEETITREFALLKVKSSPSSLTKIKKILPHYKVRIADQSDKVVVLEQSGTSIELDAFEKEMKTFGIVEMVRSGKLVIAKGREET